MTTRARPFVCSVPDAVCCRTLIRWENDRRQFGPTFGELATASADESLARAQLLHLIWHRRHAVGLAVPLVDSPRAWPQPREPWHEVGSRGAGSVARARGGAGRRGVIVELDETTNTPRPLAWGFVWSG